MASDYTGCVMGRILSELEVLFLWLGDKSGREGGSVMPLVLQIYFRDHSRSLDDPNLNTQFTIMSYHSDILIGSTFRICSPIGNISITLLSYQSINGSNQAERR